MRQKSLTATVTTTTYETHEIGLPLSPLPSLKNQSALWGVYRGDSVFSYCKHVFKHRPLQFLLFNFYVDLNQIKKPNKTEPFADLNIFSLRFKQVPKYLMNFSETFQTKEWKLHGSRKFSDRKRKTDCNVTKICKLRSYLCPVIDAASNPTVIGSDYPHLYCCHLITTLRNCRGFAKDTALLSNNFSVNSEWVIKA